MNYSEAVRGYLEELVRREKAGRLMERIEEFRRNVSGMDGNLSAEEMQRNRDEI